MNQLLFRTAGAAGLLALVWVASGYLRTQPLALVMTLLMAGFYVMGVLELRRYQRTTAGLQQALLGLQVAPADAAEHERWLALVPTALRTPVRLRVAGERAALPGPALAPYLAGLLVLLGMLGTFIGMVLTLNGTGAALEQAGSVQGMRDALAAPVRGLGLAFGTSVAGVAASAMLGLMSALCRRDRQHTGQLLDLHTSTTLQAFSKRSLADQQRRQERDAAVQLQHQLQQQQHQALQDTLQQTLQATQQLQNTQAQQALRALQWHQEQAPQLPRLADRMQGLMAQLDHHTQQSAQALLASQQHFQGQAQQAYGELAASVSQALQHSLDSGAHRAAHHLQAAVDSAMAGISRETAALHTQVATTMQQQLQGFAQRFEAQATQWLHSLHSQAQQQQAAQQQALKLNLADQQAQQSAHEQQRQAAFAATLASLAEQLQHTSSQMATQSQAQARSTLDELGRLVHTATEAPRASVQVMAEVMADVAAQLRHQLSDSLARDNGMLQERSRIMDTLHTLLGAVQHTSTEQKAAVDQMLASSAAWLQQAGARHNERVDAETARLEAVSAQLTSSAVDVASLGEALGAAVDLYSQSNQQLVAHLQHLQDALATSSARSDDQLAYYVAQAREVIDLSLLSQKQIVDDLQRLASRPATAAPVAVAA